MTTGEAVYARLGLPARETERTLWVIGDDRAGFEAFAPTIAAVSNRYDRLRVLLSARDAALRGWLAERFPSCRVLPMPNGIAVVSYLKRCDIRVAVFLAPVREAPRALIAGLRRRAITTVAVGDAGDPPLGPHLAAVCETQIEIDPTGAPQSPATGSRRMTIDAAVDLLGEMLARDLKPLRRGRRGVGWIVSELTRDARWRGLLSLRLVRYDDLDALRTALRSPETILCLGNGPSSEDQTLDAIGYDALFRVNHGWQQRGRFTAPDVVFTGGKPSMRAVGPAIFGLQTPDAAARFAALRTFNPLFRRSRFFDVHDMAPILRSFDWGVLRPTNGAAMLAVAVALQPARLIIAGIDLFRHQAGSYPGDITTPNAYSPGHSLESELAFLLVLLDGYVGELVIVSDALRAEWEAHSAAGDAEQFDPGGRLAY